MIHYTRRTIYYVCSAVLALMLASCQQSDRKYVASDFFTDAKVAELAEAARDGDVERVDHLVSQGVNVNAKAKDGLTPLMYALSGRTTKGFQRLLERGADPNLQTDGGESAVCWAAGREHDSEALKMVLAHHGDVNLKSHPAARYTTNYCPTPIYYAIRGRNPENARILLKAGADLDVRDSEGWTPLMSAGVHSSYHVMYVLLEAGADFRATDPHGYSVSYSILIDDDMDPTSDLVPARQKCIEFMEKRGVDFEKEKVKNAEIARQLEEELKHAISFQD